MNSSHSLACIASLIAAAMTSIAQTPGPATFDIPFSTIDGGGATSASAAFELAGTIGQPEAGPTMTGGGFELAGGFWPGVGETPIDACPADITKDDTVNIDDLLAVIGAWGVCPPPPASCPGDIAPPPSGNDAVNVDDLLSVINAWGTCP